MSKWFIGLFFTVLGHAQLFLDVPLDTAPNFFVATNGTALASGRKAAPIDFNTLFRSTTNALKTNGATFWLRGGTYTNENTFGASLVATGITIRPYPGEVVVIEEGIYFGANSRSNTVRGLNLISSTRNRSLSNTLDITEAGFEVQSPSTTTIGNNLVGHMLTGIETWSSAPNTLHYGDVVVGNGYELTTNNAKHGHSLYCQNDTGTKTIALCHLINSCSTSVDIRGTSSAFANNINFQSNFVAGADSIGLIAQNYPYEFTITRGDAEVTGVSNCVVSDNFFVHDGADTVSSIRIGEALVNVCGTNFALHFDRNLCKAGPVNLGNYDTFTFWTNLIWTDSASWALRATVFSPVLNYAPQSIEGNTYYYTPLAANHPWFGVTNFNVNVSMNTFSEWQGFCKGDSNGAFVTTVPTQVITRVQTNGFRDNYDAWWGDVLVWNPNRVSNNVVVVLAGLPGGTRIDVRYTGYLLGPSIVTTNYNGSSVTLPLTNLTTWQPNDVDWPQLPPPTNGASFRVFIAQAPVAPAHRAVVGYR